ncbi:MAG: fructose-bisphosphatase class III [Clostridia bacterium]|nr:fructose-bisphosphatase class III [Clostridia bacterium]
MNYVMSDIHGEYDKFLEMLQKIDLQDDDTLYILGNAVDFGVEPIELLNEMADRPNIYPIIGDHERMAVDVLSLLMDDISEGKLDKLSPETMTAIAKWRENGGRTTLEEFIKLVEEERQDILDYLCDFAPFEVVDIDSKTFILVHCGLGDFENKGKKLKNYSVKDLTSTSVDYDKKYFDDDYIYIVSGHVPTSELCGEDKIYQSNNNICINCDVANGGKLACLCLDTMEEYYV